MNQNKICKKCKLEFKNYYFLKKHNLNDCSLQENSNQSDNITNTESLIKLNEFNKFDDNDKSDLFSDIDFSELINNEFFKNENLYLLIKEPYIDNPENYLLKYIQSMKNIIFNNELLMIDKLFFNSDSLYKKNYYKILFEHIYKNNVEDKLIKIYIKKKLKNVLYKKNIKNFIKEFHNSEMEPISLLKKNYKFDFDFDSEPDDIPLIYDEEEYNFFKDLTVFPFIFFKEFRYYFNKLTNYEKLFIDIFYSVKKKEYNSCYGINPYILNFKDNCLVVNQYLKEDKINLNDENFTNKILNNQNLLCVLFELLITLKFIIFFKDYCVKNQ